MRQPQRAILLRDSLNVGFQSRSKNGSRLQRMSRIRRLCRTQVSSRRGNRQVAQTGANSERSSYVPSHRMPPTSKYLGARYGKYMQVNVLQALHQIGAVIRSGEHRPGETAYGPPRVGASVQPLPHNPRIQRKNPAATGSGERFRGGQVAERTGPGSNGLHPRSLFPFDPEPHFAHCPSIMTRPTGVASA